MRSKDQLLGAGAGGYLSDMERGTRNPSVKAIGRLAVALGVEPAELLARKP